MTTGTMKQPVLQRNSGIIWWLNTYGLFAFYQELKMQKSFWNQALDIFSYNLIFHSFIFLKTAIVFQIHCYTWLHQNTWISWDPAQEEFINLIYWFLYQWHVLISVIFSLTLKAIVSSCWFGSGIRFSQPWEMCGFAFVSWLFICCCCYFFPLKKSQTVPSQLK